MSFEKFYVPVRQPRYKAEDKVNRTGRLKGSLMLLLAAFFWGTTFAAQSSAADSIPPFTFNAARSFVGAAFLGILILIRQGKRGQENGSGGKSRAASEMRETESRAASEMREPESIADSEIRET